MNHFEALLLFEQFQESCSCNFQNSVGSLSRSLCLLPREEDHVGSALRNAACGRSDCCCCPRLLLSLLELAPCQVLLKSSSFFSALLKGARLQGSCQPTPPPFLFPTPGRVKCFSSGTWKGVRRQTNCHFRGVKIDPLVCLSSSTSEFTDFPPLGSPGGEKEKTTDL